MLTSGIFGPDYHSKPDDPPCLSQTIAKILIQASPLHAWTAHPKLNPNYQPRYSKEMDLGTIVHAMLLQGESVAVVIDAENWRTKAAQEARDAARAAGKCPILAREMPAVEAMIRACRIQLATHAEASNAFCDGRPEQTLIWQEPNGVWCRSRVDWLHDSYQYIDDLKTVGRTANPEVLSRTIFNDGLDIQAAFYLRGLSALMTDSFPMRYVEPQFRLVFIETEEPYALSVLSLAPAALALANAKIEYAIRTWDHCLTNDSWPGYAQRICYAEVPAWEENRFMERSTQ